MSRTRTLESVFWNISNGGMGFSIIEKRNFRKSTVAPPDWQETLRTTRPAGYDEYRAWFAEHQASWPVELLVNRRWIFRVRFTSFGSGVNFEFPLVPLMVDWMADALQRVKIQMEAPQERPSDGLEYAFNPSYGCSRYGNVSTRNGKKVKMHWTERGLQEPSKSERSGLEEEEAPEETDEA